MFPKSRRIPREMFPLLTDGVKTYKNNLFLLRLVLKSNQKSRFGFSISKKIAKGAVVRNKLRRAGYLALGKYLPLIKSNVLAIFSFKIIPKNNEEVVKNLELILKESKLIK